MSGDRWFWGRPSVQDLWHDLRAKRLWPVALVLLAGIVAVVLPYMILTLSAVIESIPRQTEEAAANLGARPVAVFRRVVLPLALPGVAAGSVLVFVLCMNTYATAILLGGPQFKMMAPAVYDQFVRGTNWPFGAALAFIALVIVRTYLTTAPPGVDQRS